MRNRLLDTGAYKNQLEMDNINQKSILIKKYSPQV